MRYHDILYGALEIPQEVWALFGDPLLVRLRGISQAVLPVEMNPFTTAVNRFQHGIGVWHLATRLCERSQFKHLAPTLPLAGLLHDAGNPPFSHTGEWFLRAATGHDGETHLRQVLLGTPLAGRLEQLGADPELLCDLVSGRAKPWSDLLAGSLDLDNVDNVQRYGRAGGFNVYYGAYRIVDAFSLSDDGDALELDGSAAGDVSDWLIARIRIYDQIYSDPHLALAMMLHRAVELAHLAGDLPSEFWRMTDHEAVRHLIGRCGHGTRVLVQAVERLQPYQCVAEWASSDAAELCAWSDWRTRTAVADEFAEAAGLKPWEVAAYLGRGKGHKEVALPLRQPDGTRKGVWHLGSMPSYRIRIYSHRKPGSVARLLTSNVVAFVRHAINGRIARPISIPAAVGRSDF